MPGLFSMAICMKYGNYMVYFSSNSMTCKRRVLSVPVDQAHCKKVEVQAAIGSSVIFYHQSGSMSFL
jgi:hypothetical protein